MLEESFGYPVGFSDHTVGVSIPLASIALGSKVIEKHFTLDKNLPGWDHAISADPTELKIIVDEGRNIIDSMGVSKRIVSEDEINKIKKFRRSAVLTRDINEGETLVESDLDFKRPGTGIGPHQEQQLIGRTVNKKLYKDMLISWDDLI